MVTLSKKLNILASHFPHLYNRDDNSTPLEQSEDYKVLEKTLDRCQLLHTKIH